MSDLLIFIPGNPSIPGIYDDFVEDLQKRLQPMRSYVLSHRGQDRLARKIDSPDSVERLIQQHGKSIDEILDAEQPQRTYLAGHSLGSAIAIRLYPALAGKIDKLILICPFLGPQPNNTPFLRVISVSSIRALLVGLTRAYLGMKNPSLHTLRYRLSLGERADAVHQCLTTGHFLANFLGLVSGYIRFFRSNDISAEVSALPLHDTLYVFADNDFWVPRRVVECLPAGARLEFLPDIEHAFCLQPDQSSRVAEFCASFLQRPEPSTSPRALADRAVGVCRIYAPGSPPAKADDNQQP